ncbi:MAG: 16S rRNA (adenine(1518)-N(6)/adenine(1519)-N(6))-dimethyltransferase RsmA [Candidatus Omnitrophota bacterium]
MIFAKKRLGQNFLIDKNIINNIINTLSLTKDDIVLEIGPGHGELTKRIVKNVKKLIACEIDKKLVLELEKELSSFGNIEIINLDFLKLDIPRVFPNLSQKIKVVGNLPYYISSPIIAHLLENKKYIDYIFLTLQKEFIRRIIYNDNSSLKGAFSFFVQYHSNPKLIFDISRTCFRPIPKVDSSFIMLAIKESVLKKDDEEIFFKIIRRSFQQRRKTLRNSLKEFFPKEILLTDKEFNFNLRPQALGQKDFIKLTQIYKKY